VRRLRVTQPTVLRAVDATSEAFAIMVARPWRSIVTCLGTLLAVAWFVAVLGLVSTANAQVASAFTQRLATQVRVVPINPGPAPTAYPYPPDVQSRVQALHGVIAAGVFWRVRLAAPVTVSPAPQAVGQAAPVAGQNPPVFAATPGFLSAAGVRISQGRLYGNVAQSHAAQVCLLGADAARSLRITDVALQPVLLINNESCVVIGIVSRALRQPSLLHAVMLPSSTATVFWGPPDQHVGAIPTVLIQTRPGAALVVARQAPYAISPTHPRQFRVSVRHSPQLLRDQVNAALLILFRLAGWVSLAIGILAVATFTWLSVAERIPEYALRRTLGARRRHIAGHVMGESVILGLLGGLAGASLGVAVVVLVAHARHWTPVVAPLTVLLAPLGGAAAGVIAGIVPAIRAARVQPARALSRSAAA
jgi:putative ABC transport system permease protein